MRKRASLRDGYRMRGQTAIDCSVIGAGNTNSTVERALERTRPVVSTKVLMNTEIVSPRSVGDCSTAVNSCRYRILDGRA